jgi:tetratricopeptide (TPR) repeat protein
MIPDRARKRAMPCRSRRVALFLFLELCLLLCLSGAGGATSGSGSGKVDPRSESDRAEKTILDLTEALGRNRGHVPTWMALGEAYQAAGDLGEAREAFRQAAERSGYSLEALRKWSEVAFQTRKWGEVKNACGRILVHLPDDPIALYRRGIAYRETSKYKATLPRWLDWRSSERMFKRLIRQDSLYDDAFYQYALLKRLRGRFTEAIDLAERQLAHKPGDALTELQLRRIYQSYLDNRSAPEVVAWLKGHTAAHAGDYLGEALRLAGMTAEADSVLRQWVTSAPKGRVIPAYLSLARVNYELGRPREGEAHFWAAVAAIRDTVDAALVYEDVKYVVNDQEMAAFARLSWPDEYAAYFRKVWVSRDPIPSQAYNVRLAEHYRRLLYVEKYYLFDGLKTWHDTPNRLGELDLPPPFALNDRLNAMGVIYVRHGAPRDTDKGSEAGGSSNESWYYSKTAKLPRMVFHFSGGVSSWGSNWRLTSPPGSRNRVRWDVEKRIREARRSVELGYRTDRHTWGKREEPLETNLYVATFAGEENLRTLEVYYDVPIKQLGKRQRADADTSAVYEYSLSLHDDEWRLLDQQIGQETYETIQARRRGGHAIGMVRSDVRTSRCQVGFHIRPAKAGRLAVWRGGVDVPRYGSTALGISSVVPAFSVGPDHPVGGGVSERRGIYFIPNASRKFRRNKPVHLYFEVYNLTPNESGITSYEITYTITQKGKTTFQKALALFGGGQKPSISVSAAGLGESSTAAEYVALDLRKAGRGEFRLDVAVKDSHSADKVEASLDVELE